MCVCACVCVCARGHVCTTLQTVCVCVCVCGVCARGHVCTTLQMTSVHFGNSVYVCVHVHHPADDEDAQLQLALEASRAPMSALDELVQHFDALHFSITNTPVLGHYRWVRG